MSTWKNFGDNSYLTEGGHMVRPSWSREDLIKHPSLSSQYDVLCLFPTENEKVFAYMKHVDVDDYKTKQNAIKDFFGYIAEADDEYAAQIAAYIGCEPSLDEAFLQKGMYARDEDYTLTKEQAKQWLLDLKVPEEHIK